MRLSIKSSLFEVNLYDNRVTEGGVVHRISSTTTRMYQDQINWFSFNLSNNFASLRTWKYINNLLRQASSKPPHKCFGCNLSHIQD